MPALECKQDANRRLTAIFSAISRRLLDASLARLDADLLFSFPGTWLLRKRNRQHSVFEPGFDLAGLNAFRNLERPLESTELTLRPLETSSSQMLTKLQ